MVASELTELERESEPAAMGPGEEAEAVSSVRRALH